MSGSVELAPDGANLLIRFAYREDLVALVKELPGRRWDPKGKVWRVPAAHVEQVYAALSRHLFDFAPEIPSLLAGTLGKPAAPAEPARGRQPRQTALPLAGAADGAGDGSGAGSGGEGDAPASLTISALNELVRDGLRQLFPQAFWVVGEVVDFDKSAGRQHRFFQLVEKARGAPRALAAVEIALFANTAERLLAKLASGAQPMTLRDGLEIRVLVKVDLYPASGRFQIVVQDIDPTFTLGKLALTREQILADLRQQGLADRNRSLGFPVPMLRVGVLASPDSDGWNDFLRHLEESRSGCAVTLFPIKVQGIELKPSVLAGLAWFAQRTAEFDVLCIVRGGGSRTDLAWFDDRDIALAVARHPLKVVVGIGHQRDQSVLDAIAHSEKTPTAVAELIARNVAEARADVRERALRLQDAVADILADRRHELGRSAHTVQRAALHLLAEQRHRLAAAGRELASGTRLRLARERADLRTHAARASHLVARLFERQTARLDQMAMRQRLLDPARVLGRGYALVRDTAGRVLPSAQRLADEQAIQVQFRDGRADVRVVRVQNDPS